MPFRDSVAARVNALGAAEVARRYYLASGARPHHPDLWAWNAVWAGEDLDSANLNTDLWFSLLLATLDACPDDETELWLLGDGPFDHIAARPGVTDRIYEERTRNEKLRRLFDVMRQWLPSEGVTDGWWFA